MNKTNLSVISLLLASLLFVSLSIAMAVNIVSTPITVQVLAPAATTAVAPTTNAATPTAATTPTDAAGVPALLAIAQDDQQAVDQKNKAIDALAAITGGDPAQGKAAFVKNCAVCHKVRGEGADHAPDLSEVATRLTRQKIVESIVQPSAIVEEKYKTTMVATLDGEVLTGLLIENKDGLIKLFDGKVTREISEDDIDIMQTKEQSSMPTKLADTLAEGEFLSVVEYLSGLKKIE